MEKLNKATKIKLVLGNEIHGTLPTKTYSELLTKVTDIFGSKMNPALKLYYLDAEGDMILVSTQEDYEVALLQGSDCVKFFLSDTAASLRQSLAESYSVTEVKTGETAFEVVNKEEAKIKEPTKESSPQPESALDTRYPAEKEHCFRCGKTKYACQCCLSRAELVEQYAEQAKKMVKLELDHVSASEMKTKMQALMLCHQLAMSTPVFGSAVCSICGTNPIKDVMYQCVTCPKCFLCDRCEANFAHEHPLLKVRVGLVSPVEPSLALGAYTDQYKADFFDNNGRTQHRVFPEQMFSLDWIVKNVGKTAWSESTMFSQTGGQGLFAQPYKVGVVKPGEFAKFRLTVRVPKEPGKYTTFFQMRCNEYTKFGPRVRATIMVVKGADDVKSMKNSTLMAKLHVPKSMQENMVKLMDMCKDMDPAMLLEMLRKAKNNLQEAANSIFSISQLHD